MESAQLSYIYNRVGDDWWLGGHRLQFYQLIAQRYQELIALDYLPKILLAESQPNRFLAGFLAAKAAGCPVFFSNSNCADAEWQQVLSLVQPQLIWTDNLERQYSPFSTASYPHPIIAIPTGGSSGKLRFALHNWDTLTASARSFQKYFQLDQVNSLCVLPVDRIGGLMQFIRSWTSGGKLVIWSFKSLVAGKFPDLNPAEFTISLVPTQLQRLLEICPNWLSQFQMVLLGGAPAWTELLNTARKHRIPLAPTYGMTETASQVATLKPEDFLGGNNSCGQVLPHAEITIGGNSAEILSPGEIGIVNIKADSLALGYYSESQKIAPQFATDDLGYLDAEGYLYIVGRNSQKIITGGVNVFPAEVEAAIFATNLVSDVVVIGIPDAYWGEAVTAIYVARSHEVLPEHLAAAIASTLSKFKQPKHWLNVAILPRNSQGKISYQDLLQLLDSPSHSFHLHRK